MRNMYNSIRGFLLVKIEPHILTSIVFNKITPENSITSNTHQDQ